MVEVFLRTLPFFAIIGLGYWAGRSRFITEEANAYLTKFVFYFALSAMLFRFSANLPFSDIFNGRLILGYLWGTAFVYGIATAVAFLRGLDVPSAAVEAQCAAIGNVGPGLGRVGSTGNFNHISIAGKWILSATMLLGRLEIYALVMFFIPRQWRGYSGL